MNPLRLSCVALVALATPATAQADWNMLPAAAARYGQALVHDPVRQVTVLYGGSSATPMHDTWEWNGSSWRRLGVPSGPTLGVVHGGVFDPMRQQVVVFGTAQPQTPLEVWGFDGASWVQHPSPSTSPVGFAAVAYDSVRSRIVVNAELPLQSRWNTFEWDGSMWHTNFGLYVANWGPMAFDPVRAVCVTRRGGSTWTWDGTTWTELGYIGNWQPRDYGIVWDPRRQAVVLAGGAPASVFTFTTDEIRLWNGSTWTVAPERLPDPRLGFGLCFDATANGLLVAGGRRRLSLAGDFEIAVGTYTETPTGWQRGDTDNPAARERPGLCHDLARDRLVMFGGRSGDPRASHFEWAAASGWSERTLATAPPARWRHRMVYDRARQVVLLFGGLDTAPRGDTWTWSGATWNQRTPANAPSPRYDAAMSYDEDRDVVVLYGGRDGTSVHRDTWEWNGSSWTQRVASFPPSEQRALLAWDPLRRRTVLATSGAPGPVTIWEWDGANWRSLSQPASRPNLTARELLYDRARGRLVLLGSGAGGSKTWEYDGSSWNLRSSAGPDLDGAAALDEVRNRIVFVGGRTPGNGYVADVWEYATPAPASYDAFGQGCPGSLGVPSLTADGLPWLGDNVTVRVDAVPAAAVAFVSTGFSRTSYLGTPLPFGLGPLGHPGCAVLAAPEIVLQPAGAPATTRTLSLALPASPIFAGTEFFQQALLLDPAAAQLAVSNGAAARLGIR